MKINKPAPILISAASMWPALFFFKIKKYNCAKPKGRGGRSYTRNGKIF